MSEVAANLAAVQERVRAACRRASRAEDSVNLIAVSKLQPSTKIREAYDAGQRQFGENYAQELRDKAQELAKLPGIGWHALGGLQLNKAKYVAGHAHAFHALDRLELAEELNRRRSGPPLLCFLEVNLGAEASKGGIAPEAAPRFLSARMSYPALSIVGLMALPPLGANPEDSRPHFRKLRNLAGELGLEHLSMGTTFDFEVAIEEGATEIRVGEAIFGKRPARNEAR